MYKCWNPNSFKHQRHAPIRRVREHAESLVRALKYVVCFYISFFYKKI
jgi:hypothetical protein